MGPNGGRPDHWPPVLSLSIGYRKKRYFTKAAMISTSKATPINPPAPIPHIMSSLIISFKTPNLKKIQMLAYGLE